MTLRRHLLVGQSTNNPRGEVGHALFVGQLASAVAVVELGQVARKVLDADRVVRAAERPLQLAEEPLDRVGPVGLVGCVDTGLVVDGVVPGQVASDGDVGAVRVRVQNRVRHVDVRRNDLTNGPRVNPSDRRGTRDATLGVDQRDNRDLGRTRRLVLANRATVGLVAWRFIGSPPM